VELMQGRIWVDSQPGMGSTFSFTARFGRGTDRGPRQHIDLEDLRELPVLIVDDNETNLRILEEMLKNWDMAPTTVEGAPQAIECLRKAQETQRPFALVISDVHMPDMDGFGLVQHLRGDPLCADAPVILLTSASQTGHSERCRELGVAAHLLKPVKHSVLLDAIVTAVAGAGTAAERKPVQPAPAGDGERDERPLRILLAEDNAINRKFAVRTLNRRGHAVVVAGNGKEAVEAYESGPFDVILMDVQMPEMDGFEATVAIRERESDTGIHVPIIALTAHAMKGDRQTCLDAGMDGYVTKPIKAATLFAEIERVLSGTSSASGGDGERTDE
jgi:CheY-like chemotaxis protein